MGRPPKVMRKTCKTCGIPFFTTVEKALTRRQNGTTFYYCSPECRGHVIMTHKDDTRFFRGFTAEEYDTGQIDPWKLLAISILSLALEDYKRVVQNKRLLGWSGSVHYLNIREEIEDFFRSGWAELLAMGSLSQEEMDRALARIRTTYGGRT